MYNRAKAIEFERMLWNLQNMIGSSVPTNIYFGFLKSVTLGQIIFATSMLTRALMGLWIFHHLLGGGGCLNTPPSISAPAHRRTKRKTVFESSRKIISKSFRSFFGSGQNWGHQRSKYQNFPKRFLDDKIINFKDRATILIPSCLSRQGASNRV